MFVIALYVVRPGENKVSVMSAVRFIKLLFQYKQPEAFSELARAMLQVLPVSSTNNSHWVKLFSKV